MNKQINKRQDRRRKSEIKKKGERKREKLK